MRLRPAHPAAAGVAIAMALGGCGQSVGDQLERLFPDDGPAALSGGRFGELRVERPGAIEALTRRWGAPYRHEPDGVPCWFSARSGARLCALDDKLLKLAPARPLADLFGPPGGDLRLGDGFGLGVAAPPSDGEAGRFHALAATTPCGRDPMIVFPHRSAGPVFRYQLELDACLDERGAPRAGEDVLALATAKWGEPIVRGGELWFFDRERRFRFRVVVDDARPGHAVIHASRYLDAPELRAALDAPDVATARARLVALGFVHDDDDRDGGSWSGPTHEQHADDYLLVLDLLGELNVTIEGARAESFASDRLEVKSIGGHFLVVKRPADP
ncbi:MAG: hypothetical protein IT385_00920 [Deltaproteobacteria bacterium]|nr:hypothetical protein [Deltaproteobacteria bacterium]